MKKMKLEHYVIASISIVIIYTILEFVVGCNGILHDGLTPYVYGFFGGEIVTCGLIKIFKLKDDNNENDS